MGGKLGVSALSVRAVGRISLAFDQDGAALRISLIPSLQKHEASGQVSGPTLSFDGLRMRVYCEARSDAGRAARSGSSARLAIAV